MTGTIAAVLRRHFTDLEVSVASLTSREIVRQLSEYSLDAGVTYLEHEPPANAIGTVLYHETSVFVASAGRDPTNAETISLQTALSQPLCLLHQGMQNRRILDANLAAIGMSVHPKATADSYVAILALVYSGDYGTIMPDSYVPLLPSWAKVRSLDTPLPTNPVGLIVADRHPIAPLAEAALTIARTIQASNSQHLSEID